MGTPNSFRHNPYDQSCLAALHNPVLQHSTSSMPTADDAPQPHDTVSTLHRRLEGLVSFVEYPTHEISMPQTNIPKHELQRLFIGQLPYTVTEMQLQWLCDVFTNNCELYHMERIINWNAQQPKGCVHCYCFPEEADIIIRALNKKVLLDDSGVWYASSEDEVDALHLYCEEMKNNKKLRFRDRPYQTVVVQIATSTFVPRCSTPPPQVLKISTPPPPAYNRPPEYQSLVLDIPDY